MKQKQKSEFAFQQLCGGGRVEMIRVILVVSRAAIASQEVQRTYLTRHCRQWFFLLSLDQVAEEMSGKFHE